MIGAVVLGHSYTIAGWRAQKATFPLLLAAACVFVAGILTAYLTAKGLYGPIRRVTEHVQRITDGDLDSGTMPRQAGRMTHKDISEIERLKRQLAERDARISKLEREVARSEKVADALGKAIDVMHSHGVEPGKAEND